MAAAVAVIVIVIVEIVVVAAIPFVPVDAPIPIDAVAEQAPVTVASPAAAGERRSTACHEQNGGGNTHD
jgi:hypothetical protein